MSRRENWTIKEGELFNIKVPFSAIGTEAQQMFENSIKRSIEGMVERLAKPVLYTREILHDKTRLLGQYRMLKLDDESDSETLSITDGSVLKGEAIGSLEFKSGYLLIFLVTLKNYDETELSLNNAIERFYLDSWGSSYIWNAINHIKASIMENLEDRGYEYSRFLFPGQNGLSLENQRAVFSMLEPEKLSVSLNESCLMNPLKSYTSFLICRSRQE